MHCIKSRQLGLADNGIEGISKTLFSCGLSKQMGITVSFKAQQKIHILHVIREHKQSANVPSRKKRNEQFLDRMTAEIKGP